MNSINFRHFLFLLVSFFVVEKADSQCISDAGTMSLSLIEVCATATVTGQPNADEMLDTDDVLQFVMHTNSGISLGSILASNSTPEFSFLAGTMTYFTTYYISAIVGNNDGSGNVDLNDPCLSVAAGTPVRWRTLPTATMTTQDFIVCDGNVDVQATVFLTGTAPWTLQWSKNGTPQTTVFIASNPYTLFLGSSFANSTICLTSVTDANACNGTVSGCITITQPPVIVCNPVVTDVSCAGLNDGSIQMICTGGTPPFDYFWSDGQSSPTASGLSAGAYTVTVVDINGCSSQSIFFINEPVSPLCFIDVSGSINCTNPEATIFASCNGGPLTYVWADPTGAIIGNGPSTVVTTSGNYSVTITDINGCTSVVEVIVPGGTLDCGAIIGTLTSETDGNCTLDPGENGLFNWMVRATASNGDEYFDFTDADGNYAMQASPGDYTVEAIPPAAYWADCGSPVLLTLEDANDTDTADFHYLQTINCPMMEVDISAPLLRRCFNNNYYVNYCNNGSETASSVSIEVTLDPLITIVSANMPFSGPVNGVYTFDILGNVEPGQCGNFYFLAHVSCDAVLGQTLCAEAHVFPDSLCMPVAPNWSGAILEIASDCTADSVIFTITNTGTGDMTEPQGFIVVEDGVMLLTNDVQLAAGESITVSFPANGSTYNILAEQVPGVPGFSNPSMFVEGCGTNGSGTFSTGFASQFPEDDNGPFISIDCHDVIGSYDPNDKTGYPLGYGDQHLIEVGQPLDYHIRFQNTGTDTAFFVKIQDVIDPSLDIATLRPGASSHPYQLDINQDTLIFIFENILLPDSNVNEVGSHGFVKFHIGQRAGVPLGTVIVNEAAIFFDFNDPILTNKTTHKLGDHFIETTAKKPVLPKAIQCNVYPNPFSDEAMVVVQGVENQELELRLYDLTGRYLRSEKIRNGVGKIKKNELAAGLYFYEIRANGAAVGQGKLAVE